MSMLLIRNQYNVPAKRGTHVRRRDNPSIQGVIMRAKGPFLRIKVDKSKLRFKEMHPLALEYKNDQGEWELPE